MDRERPLISVIVPVYNVEKYLKACVDSIVAQTYRSIEIILVDDGSTDRSGELCERYASDGRVMVLHKENGGLSSARNAGLDVCRGEYVAFIDSDDFVSPYFIEILYKAAAEYGADLAYCATGLSFLDGTDEAVQLAKDADDLSAAGLAPGELLEKYLYQSISNGAVWGLYRRTLFETVRFPVGYVFEDIATIYRVMILARRAAMVYAHVYAYRTRSGSTLHSGFAEKKMVAVDITRQLYAAVCTYDGRLQNAAASRAFSLNFHVFLQAPAGSEYAAILWKEIKKYRWRVLLNFSRQVRMKNRAGALISCFGRRTAAWFGKKLIKQY